MPASNSKDCFRECVGKKIKGILFDALPRGRFDLSSGTKTFIFEDGTGLTFASNGSYWLEDDREIQLVIGDRCEELERVQKEIAEVISVSGGKLKKRSSK